MEGSSWQPPFLQGSRIGRNPQGPITRFWCPGIGGRWILPGSGGIRIVPGGIRGVCSDGGVGGVGVLDGTDDSDAGRRHDSVLDADVRFGLGGGGDAEVARGPGIGVTTQPPRDGVGVELDQRPQRPYRVHDVIRVESQRVAVQRQLLEAGHVTQRLHILQTETDRPLVTPWRHRPATGQ